MEHEGNFDWIKECEKLEELNKTFLEACKGALAALTQNKTYPADIEAAKQFLTKAISNSEGVNHE